MRGAMLSSVVLAVLLLAASAWGAGPTEAEIKARLHGPFVPPAWLAEVQVPFTAEELTATNKYGLTIWSKIFSFQSNPDRFREAVATMHKVLALNSKPAFRAEAYQTLGLYYEGMFQDYVRSFQMFRELSNLADEVKQVHDWQNHLSRDTRRVVALGMARGYARLGLAEEARALLAEHSFEDWRELLALAVIYRVLGDRKSSDEAIERGIAAGQKNLWQQVSVGSRGIILFYINGNRQKVRQYVPAYLKSYQAFLSQEGGQVLGTLIGQHRMVLLIRKSLDEPIAVDLTALPDGTFLGQSPGIQFPIQVSVTVTGGKIADVKVTEINETRPFNAAEYVPAKIVERQSLDVDAVTGATVTSLGIVHAVREALRTAGK